MSKLAKVALVLAVSMSGVSGSAWAINKCVDANGRTSFQDEPCASEQKAQEMVVTPSSRGINPTEGSKPSAHRPSSQTLGVSAPAAQAGSSAERPSDCPSVQEMQKLQVEADSVALPLPIRNQKRQDFEALKQRCG
mgnify:FL=1